MVRTLLTLLLLIPNLAKAQQIHVFGPEGTPDERRALVVVEDEIGGCAPWNAITLDAGTDVELRLEDPGPGCARWVRWRPETPRAFVVLRVEGAVQARTVVPMGQDAHLEVRLRRVGSRIAVELPHRDRHAVVRAYWPGGASELQADGHIFRGRGPASGPVGVVVRSGGSVGAALDHDPTQGGVFIMPALPVPAGGVPRNAAFVAVSGGAGAAHSDVPLNVQAEGARLRRLTWIRPGLATVALSVDEYRPDVSLRATVPGRPPVTSRLPVVAGWPQRMELRVSAPLFADAESPLRLSAWTSNGNAVAATRLALRCGGELKPADRAGRVDCEGLSPGRTRLVGTVEVDGRPVPMAMREVRVEPPPTPLPDVRLGAYLAGCLAADGTPHLGGGLSLTIPSGSLLSARLELGYRHRTIEAFGSQLVVDDLQGHHHALELLGGVEWTLLDGGVGLGLRTDIGVAGGYSDAEIAGSDASGVELRFVAQVAAMSFLRVDATRLGVSIGGRVAPPIVELWASPLFEGFVTLWVDYG
ncbi:MAG: hypothetical protein AAGF12_23705 [Myxococcota bacterium]